ncbi:MAG: RnfABCDGE type electron transport complex subunit G [Paramuribaculum sp.]|nr:RnfABCDGE type electron transport complex subunit G [Paramuribaculum sp.]
MKKDSLAGMVMSLGVITVIAGALLGIVNYYTADAIENAAQQAKVDALALILPEFDNAPIAEAKDIAVEGDTLLLYPATREGIPVGCAVECIAHDGFSGDISLMFGFTADGTVCGYKVLSHSETPGLGAKMDEWFRDMTGRRSVIGITPGKSDVRVFKDGGEIDGITAATITSRAFLGALNHCYKAYESYYTNK